MQAVKSFFQWDWDARDVPALLRDGTRTDLEYVLIRRSKQFLSIAKPTSDDKMALRLDVSKELASKQKEDGVAMEILHPSLAAAAELAKERFHCELALAHMNVVLYMSASLMARTGSADSSRAGVRRRAHGAPQASSSTGKDTFDVNSPATGNLVGEAPEVSESLVNDAVQAAASAAAGWRRLSQAQRAAYLQSCANVLRDNLLPLATLQTNESGRPLPETRIEVLVAAANFEAAGKLLDIDQGEVISEDESKKVVVRRSPLGVWGDSDSSNWGSSGESVRYIYTGTSKGGGKHGKGKGFGFGKDKGWDSSTTTGTATHTLEDGPVPLPVGEVPKLSVSEAHQLAALHSKAGDSEQAQKYKQLALALERSEHPPEVSPQQRVQQAHAKVRRIEKNLKTEFTKLTNWRSEVEAQRQNVSEMHEELIRAGAEYKQMMFANKSPLQSLTFATKSRLSWLRWKSMWQPGIPGSQGGGSCGVAVFARSWLGVIDVPEFEGEAGRSFVCKVHSPAIPSFLLRPLYLQRSVGVDEHNGKSRGEPPSTFRKLLFKALAHPEDPVVRGLKWLDAQVRALKSELECQKPQVAAIAHSLLPPPATARTAQRKHPEVFSARW
ncbi:unnamed protein product [Prorocentrum cordatum]|uniref:Aldehyde dehydrogenase domain-containing protein n=1 Tax=Prorocentrum cordatum TaxID=2364126 RepID=A0ABN9U1J0_9DINO|nr:unnamed protein product [Polarella glacialis]